MLCSYTGATHQCSASQGPSSSCLICQTMAEVVLPLLVVLSMQTMRDGSLMASHCFAYRAGSVTSA